jgi:GDP-4-dehydro-6-deoxy-D-mannose reductase
VRIWVSGARGFVGSWLVPRLEASGHVVVAVDREVDATDAAAVAASIASSRPDALVHLAGLASVAASLGDPAATARVNTLGALHLLRSVQRHAPMARVLLVGSGEVYGASEDGAAFDESAALRPGSPYARSKAAADRLGAAFAARGLDVIRARPFNHTGPGQSDAFVASSFARQLAEIEAGRREPELRVGNLEAVRDFLDVRDVVDAYERLLDHRIPTGAYNIASGAGISIGHLLDLLLARSTAHPALREDPARWRPADVAIGDASRLRRRTGWQPGVAFRDTLAHLLEDWRRRVSGSP